MASECSASSVYEEYDPLDFLYGETEMRDTPVYATISKKESPVMPSPPPKSIPTVPAVTLRSTTVSIKQTRRQTLTQNNHSFFFMLVLNDAFLF